MKNARTTNSNASAQDKREYTIDFIPRRMATILAGVLARLLEGGRPLTTWDGVEEFRTLHLDAAIRTLKKKYQWPIQSIDIPTRMPDGTIFYVTGYKLPQVAIDYAYSRLGAHSWIRAVKVAQARKRARDCAKAAALDFYRRANDHLSF